MKIKVLGSGSAGNCYLVEDKGEIIILDCGIKKKDILVGLNFDVSKVVGCLVTHAHSDHKRAVKELEKMCIKCFKPYETDNGDHILSFKWRKWSIYAFPLEHNGTKNYGYLIEHMGEKLLYMTDFEYCMYNFKSEEIDHMIIECNYREEHLDRNLPNYEHKVLGHCSLDTCIRTIRANNTDSLKSVILAHLGECIGDRDKLLTDVKKTLNSDIFVAIANKGLEYEF